MAEQYNPLQHVQALANEIGRSKGLSCKREYDSRKQGFVFRFYRRGRYLGKCSDPKAVVGRMEKYATAI